MKSDNEDEIKKIIQSIVSDYKLEEIIYKREGESEKGIIIERIVFLATKKDDKNVKKYIIKADLINGTRETEKIFVNELKNNESQNLEKCYQIIDKNNIVIYIKKYYNGGDLYKYIKKLKEKGEKFKIEEIISIMKHVFNGLYYLHERKIIHRDIKPRNLLIHYENEENPDLLKSHIVIIDYGCCKRMDDKKELNNNAGTNFYKHPIFFNKEKKNKLKGELDIWSLGITFLELLDLDLSEEEIKDEKKGTYLIPYNEDTTIEMVRFIDQMLQEDEKQQAKLEKLMKDVFLNESINHFNHLKYRKVENKIEIKNNKKYLKLNYKEGRLNFDYDEILKDKDKIQEELDNDINDCFIQINENFLFTEPIIFPIIPDINYDEE